MSTENNTPALGTAEWLRKVARFCAGEIPVSTGELLPYKDGSGLRAAAERIELAETRLESAREVIAAYADESIRLRAENEVLRAELEGAENALRELAADAARKEGV